MRQPATSYLRGARSFYEYQETNLAEFLEILLLS